MAVTSDLSSSVIGSARQRHTLRGLAIERVADIDIGRKFNEYSLLTDRQLGGLGVSVVCLAVSRGLGGVAVT